MVAGRLMFVDQHQSGIKVTKTSQRVTKSQLNPPSRKPAMIWRRQLQRHEWTGE